MVSSEKNERYQENNSLGCLYNQEELEKIFYLFP
ncbi:hypothetical protein CKC_02275 [Candidatus Liberibacter solanacearum CLso-ZC1]|uniref:Uncharacterized protein n=1 Tax=Liberibacter solanacearum (strain CLso-ZC1) TaxID=658172 RepID=E4UCW6_LIBSC|nr:hypothetical protein CKC_02275 [Candidatus Liberibacter solanacearum CLso-ZC1]